MKGNGFTMDVNVRSVPVAGANGIRIYEMDLEDWNAVEEHMELECGMYIIFTRKRADKLWLTAFSVHGNLTSDVHFNGATTLRRVQPELQNWERSEFVN